MWATTYSGSDQNVGFGEPFLYYASQVLQKTVDGYFHRTKLYLSHAQIWFELTITIMLWLCSFKSATEDF